MTSTPPPQPGGPGKTAVHLDALTLADQLAAAGRGSVKGILLYGSHLSGATPDRHSALDFVVVVGDYRSFYQALRDGGEIHRPARLLWTLANTLPPNVIAFTPEAGTAGIAKCLVVSAEHLESALGPDAPDHFLVARLIQRVALIWEADPDQGAWIQSCLTGAHDRVLEWAGPYLQGPFDAESLGRRLLEICYGGEFRPEAKNRSDAIFQTQREHFRAVLTPVLERAAADGRVKRVEGGFGLARAPSAAEIRTRNRYFRRSKARVTARWFKHVLTFDNWMPYIQRKVERRMGRKVELTRIEQILPIPFLIPRAVALLFARPEREEPR